MSSSGQTFLVSAVECATTTLPEVSAHSRVNALVSSELASEVGDYRSFVREPKLPPRRFRHIIKEAKVKLAALEQQQAQETARWQAISCATEPLVECMLWHPFLAALHLAFSDHRPLCLSPDMIWLLICQGVASHINANAEELRAQFVSHTGKAEILVCRDDFRLDAPDNPWHEVIGEFSAQVRQHIGPAQELFLPAFSTTGEAERVAAEVVLLDAMQSFFNYRLQTLCGIPSITLEGTPDDWRTLKEKALRFSDWRLDDWVAVLEPVLDQFIATAEGEINVTFWQSLYQYRSGSGSCAINGWCSLFFPYLFDDQQQVRQRNPWVENTAATLRFLLHSQENALAVGPIEIAPRSFPRGLSCAPFLWEYFYQSFPMNFYGGFLGVRQLRESFALRPQIGWAVARQTLLTADLDAPHTTQ